MAPSLSAPRVERACRTLTWTLLTVYVFGALGVVFYFAFVLVVGPRDDPTGRCAFHAPKQVSSDQVNLTWSENLFTNTLTCTWSSVDDKHTTTVKLSAY